MLISRTPLRISFGGGGTDLEAYYLERGGVALSVTIDKYFYCAVTRRDDGKTQIISADYDIDETIDGVPDVPTPDDPLRVVKAALREFGLSGVTVLTRCDVPAGTGLGSSCAVSVGLVDAFTGLTGEVLPKHEIAEKAFHIDTRVLGFPIGKQDQYASAFGGLNLLRFESDGVVVERVHLGDVFLRLLEGSLMLFFAGASRSAGKVLSKQRESTASGDEQVITALDSIKELALKMREALVAEDLEGFAALLHESWMHKRGLTPDVTNERIDSAYEAARAAGALGGKICGAGGGGYLMLCCRPDVQPEVTRAMAASGWEPLEFEFDYHGTVLGAEEEGPDGAEGDAPGGGPGGGCSGDCGGCGGAPEAGGE